MARLLVILSDKNPCTEFISALKKFSHVQFSRVSSGKAAFQQIAENAIDLVITEEKLPDMTGLEFVTKLLQINPIINTAVMSSLPRKIFHEASEGMGVLMQLPPNPAAEEAEALIQKLEAILNFEA